MLVLERKMGESIIVDGNIKITVTDLKRGRVSVAVDAPKDIRIQRLEKKE